MHFLDSLDAWFHSHGLKVNTSKTELISFGSRQNCRGLDPVSIRFREDTIHEGPTVRNLGVIFDRHLTWDPHVSALVKKCLQKILNFALRAVSGRRKFDHISDVREELGWPTARQLYELHSLSFLHKIRCTGEPEALSSQRQVNSVLRSRTTRQDADLALPRVRTEAGRRRLLFNTVQSYNRLPPEIRNLPLGSFKREVRQLLVV